MIQLAQINWKSFWLAGLLANIAKALAYLAFGDKPWSSGPALLPGADPTTQIIVGTAIFVFAGQVLYALFWTVLFSGIKSWPTVLHAALAGLAQGALSYVIMPWFKGPFTYVDLLHTMIVYFVYCLLMNLLYKPKPEVPAGAGS